MDNVGVDHFAKAEPDAVAVIDADGRAVSRQELMRMKNQLARALLAAGLSPGDAVAVLALNSVEQLAVVLAGTQIGLNVIPINHHLSRDEIDYILRDSGASALVAHGRVQTPRLLALAASCHHLRVLVSVGPREGFLEFYDFISAYSADVVPKTPLGRTMAYTSATTGKPKAVSLPLVDAEKALQRTLRHYDTCGLGPSRRHVHLCASTLYHSAPLEGTTMALQMGHLVVLVEKWTPEKLLELIDKHKVTTTFMVPSMFVRLLKLPRELRDKYSTSSLKRVTHGGAPCSVMTKRAMVDWWGPILWEIYGATEGAGTTASPEDWFKYPGSVGKAIPGSQIKILSESGEELRHGEVGLVYLTRYTGDRFEYKGDEEKTRACFVGDFFTVGDIGYLNEDGYLFICDRRNDVFITSGLNVYPAEIEGLLTQHEKVADCAVVGIADELFGQVPKAIVQPISGAEPGRTLTSELLSFLGEHLSAAKIPRVIEYVSELPRDPNGKLFRRALREAERTRLSQEGQ